MRPSKKSGTVVGLDLDAQSIAASELRVNGGAELLDTAVEPLEPGVFAEGEVADGPALAEAIRAFFSGHKLGKAVRVGVANQRVVVRTLRLPEIGDEKEMEAAVRFQAQDQIPMPLEQAVLDHQVVGRSDASEGERLLDVVAVAARRDMVGSLVDSLRSAGVRPVGVDVSAFAMIRALERSEGPAPGGPAPTTLYCHLGEVTNLAVARGPNCLFTRVSPYGVDAIARRLAERRTIPIDRARELIAEAGGDEPHAPEGARSGLADGLDGTLPGGPEDDAGAARDSFREGVSKLAQGVRMSLDGYAAQETSVPIERVVACGPGIAIPGLVERLAAEIGQEMEARVPDALSSLDRERAGRLTISYGLGLEG